MNHELFTNMQNQMTPSPEVRAELDEKLAQTPKKRPVPWMKYGAVAACAALVIGGISVYSLRQNPQAWMLITRNFHHDAEVQHLHSYVTMEGLTGGVRENATETMTGGGDTGAPNTGDLAPSGALPGGAYIGEVPSQEEAINAYQKLMDHFNGVYPDWYGGAYMDDSGWLVVQLVESQDPGDKSLELKVLDWADSDHVMFSSCKYSLSYLDDLQDKVWDALMPLDLLSSSGTDEVHNRVDLTLTSVTDEALAILAELDPDDDAIYVHVGQRVRLNGAEGESPSAYHAVPGGVTVPDDEDLIADEPYYDGAHYDVENLPAELPEQKQPAFVETDSVP